MQYPSLAAQGKLNATLHILTTPQRIAMLASEPLDLGRAQHPILRFYHAQVASPFGVDELRLYFRKDAQSEWVKIDSFLSRVNQWTERIYDIKSYNFV